MQRTIELLAEVHRLDSTRSEGRADRGLGGRLSSRHNQPRQPKAPSAVHPVMSLSVFTSSSSVLQVGKMREERAGTHVTVRGASFPPWPVDSEPRQADGPDDRGTRRENRDAHRTICADAATALDMFVLLYGM